MSTRHGEYQTEKSRFLPSGSYLITNVEHGVSLSIPAGESELYGSSDCNFTWTITNDSNERWYIEITAGSWFAHRLPSHRAGNTIIAAEEQFAWVISQRHPLQHPDCYLIYERSAHTLLWGVEEDAERTPVTFRNGESSKKNWWRFQRIPDGNEDQLAPSANADRSRYVAAKDTSGSRFTSDIQPAIIS
ncbi:hypothetical protein BD410DRAFT_793727 [Rickenella mellea]|uniref:Ricin B lectin domain-containing protein n=1 Tax=Rickenella mellea TaxID=50990 RepID=A0A4Y7PT44_9AGAM|nr:hypothetical protein BD410DRAFT_793727 [Rickenella mellea]